MYPLDAVYGPSAYKRFLREGKKFKSLKSELKPSLNHWLDEPLEARSFDKLMEIVSFFSVMNKRSSLFFRGQGSHLEAIPCIFRSEWTSLGKTKHKIPNSSAVRQKIWDYLNSVISPLIVSTLKEFALPRRRSIEMFREAVWAVSQHYDVWPTPLIDVTTNLRIAASFALWAGRAEGQLYVVALTPSTNSITFDADQHIVLARLQAVCPPIARRPHYQDGYLAGRFPFAGPNCNPIDRDPEKASRLSRRLVARIKLIDARDGIANETSSDLGGFWNSDFPRVSEPALMPLEANDDVLRRLKEHAGQIDAAMADICKGP
jgi:FRG domain